MQPKIHINTLAVGAVGVISFFSAGLGRAAVRKKWAGVMKMPADFKPAPAFMTRSMDLILLGTFLIAYVLAH